jgi:two-component system LytT family response regulator
MTVTGKAVRPMRILIADDEPLARKGLRKLLGHEPGVEVVAECANGIEAVERIQEAKPDAAFLDIRMPGIDGFGVVEAIGAGRMPVTVFVTAYDHHALRAFEVHAVDYLLKPVTPERLHAAVGRAAAMLGGADRRLIESRVESLIRAIRPPGGTIERFVIRSVGKVSIVPVGEVEWIEADGDYVRLHTPNKVHLHRERISALEESLDPAEFIRIHRSTIVRIGRISELRPLLNGDHLVVLRNGEQLSLSRTLRDRVFAALQTSR